LVVGEIALALIMAVGAGLLARSLWRVRHVDAGFDAHGVTAIEIGLSRKYDTVTKVQAFMNQLMERTRAIPGLSGVATTSSLPFQGTSYTSDFVAAGRPSTGYGTEIGHRTVSPNYFSMMKVPVLRGRVFTPLEAPGTPSVVIINDVVAHSYFHDEEPVGQRITFDKIPNAQSTWYTIIAVVGSEHVDGLDIAPRSESFVSSVQFPSGSTYLLVRDANATGALVPAVRSIVHDLDASLALYSVQSMDDLREQSMAKARFLAILLLVFATIGVALSIVGVYGVLAHVSRNRTREMGIRIALGARAGQVRWLVIQQGVRLAVIGLSVGLVVALFATRGMSKLLFGVAPNDPVTLIAVVVGLAMTSALASWLPAVRASRADPAVALRSD
jgi:predicted permease